MNKKDYLDRLGDLLSCLPAADIAEAQAFYAEAIEDRMADGMAEEEAVAAIGSPGAAAEEILDSLPAVPRIVAKTRRRSTVLLWVLAILGSPVWAALLLAFLALVAAVYIAIWAVAVALWAVAVAFLVTPLITFVAAWWGVLVGNFPFAIVYAGVGIGFMGLGVLLVLLSWEVSKRFARLSTLWVRKAWSFFKKDDTAGPTDAGRADTVPQVA